MCNGKLKRIAGLEENNKRKHNICEMGGYRLLMRAKIFLKKNTFVCILYVYRSDRHMNVINIWGQHYIPYELDCRDVGSCAH